MNNIRFQNRLRQVKKMLNLGFHSIKKESAALLISSSACLPSSRDQDHPFRQNSDFIYLSGSEAQDIALLVSTELPRPLILGAKRSKERAVWDGPGHNLAALARNIQADFCETANIEAEALKRLQGIETLYYSSEPSSLALKIARKIFELPSHQRGRFPKRLSHSDLILEPLRLHKDIDEIKAIVAANRVTNTALLTAVPFITPGRTESSLASTIDYGFKLQGGEPGFSSIVASGKNAATLHHRPSNKKLSRGDLVLIDIGARLDHYNADITRVVSVGQNFTSIQKDIYEVVLSAQKAAIRKVRDGVLSGVVYEAALKELCVGLKDLGVIRAATSKIMAKKLYLPYFPHGIGHTLGLDVHDIGNLRANLGVKLQKGMVITIEPGLYFQNSTKSIPACGVRIEDNLVVTDKGFEILSEGFPKKISEIEKLF